MSEESKRKFRHFTVGTIFIFILIGGWIWPILGYFIPLCMLLGIGSGFFVGRKWCAWPCPRGSFYDSFVKPVSPKKEIPLIFKRTAFKVTIFIILIIIMVANLILRWPDALLIGRFFVLLLTLTTAAGVILALLFHPRTWCAFCPVGSLIYWINNAKAKRRTKI